MFLATCKIKIETYNRFKFPLDGTIQQIFTDIPEIFITDFIGTRPLFKFKVTKDHFAEYHIYNNFMVISEWPYLWPWPLPLLVLRCRLIATRFSPIPYVI